jgi:hypothetical protein
MKMLKSELDLKREGFRKIKSQYKGNCSLCNRRFEAGEEIYWKREPLGEVTYRTIMIYSNCWENPTESH